MSETGLYAKTGEEESHQMLTGLCGNVAFVSVPDLQSLIVGFEDICTSIEIWQ